MTIGMDQAEMAEFLVCVRQSGDGFGVCGAGGMRSKRKNVRLPNPIRRADRRVFAD